MKLEDFIRNLRQIDDGHDLDPEMLSGIYERIRNQVNFFSVYRLSSQKYTNIYPRSLKPSIKNHCNCQKSCKLYILLFINLL
jgi:Sec7-like guanine-nucleotide exchange factor